MGDEALEFAERIGAKKFKHDLFKRYKLFVLNSDKFLIIKVSRNKIRPFYGFSKPLFELFNELTKESGNFFFVALLSKRDEGWVLSKKDILSQISDGSLSCSENQTQYKINYYNLKNHYVFTSIEGFLKKVGHIN